MPSTRRQFLRAGTGGIAALAGCSAVSGPQQSLRMIVINNSEERHRFHLLIEDGGDELIRQYLEMPAAESPVAPAMETTIALEELPDGTHLDVTAWVRNGPRETAPLTLDCSNDFAGDALTARIVDSDTV
ncbi:hypothetical protein [Halomarina litorea]|uniref:hypothetical protein n=1 Tax=Halomarina litorea TaxID=2961595 RepID=UPI0020C566B0|nr:hypothetical protein [Halomarina sp. BCD28]